jgi:diguanylate cyclase (GGDEF)-like protein
MAHPRRRRKFTRRFAAIGALLSLGAPAGMWLLLRVVQPEPADGMRWVYGYLAVATAIVFTTFGALSGALMDALQTAAIRDSLTGLYNRRFFSASLPNMRASCRRRGTPLSILMLDLDLFKRVNDTHGHAVGDQTLQAVARALEDSIRESDLLVRFGGEEFAVACPDTEPELAAEIAERIRSKVAALDESALGHPGPQTISVGVATLLADGDTPNDELLRRADEALYRAKESGRNQVSVAA